MRLVDFPGSATAVMVSAALFSSIPDARDNLKGQCAESGEVGAPNIPPVVSKWLKPSSIVCITPRADQVGMVENTFTIVARG